MVVVNSTDVTSAKVVVVAVLITEVTSAKVVVVVLDDVAVRRTVVEVVVLTVFVLGVTKHEHLQVNFSDRLR